MNDLMGLISMIRGAQNPQAFLQQQAQSNPMVARALQMIQGRDPMEVAQNLAREQGIDLNAMKQQLGMFGI